MLFLDCSVKIESGLARDPADNETMCAPLPSSFEHSAQGVWTVIESDSAPDMSLVAITTHRRNEIFGCSITGLHRILIVIVGLSVEHRSGSVVCGPVSRPLFLRMSALLSRKLLACVHFAACEG